LQKELHRYRKLEHFYDTSDVIKDNSLSAFQLEIKTHKKRHPLPVPILNFVRVDKKENLEPSAPIKAASIKKKPRKCKECIQLLSLGLSTKDC